MRLLYKPLGIIFGVLGGLLGGVIFKQVWRGISDQEDAPKATESEYGWSEVLPAAAAQGAIFASSRRRSIAAARSASAS